MEKNENGPISYASYDCDDTIVWEVQGRHILGWGIR